MTNLNTNLTDILKADGNDKNLLVRLKQRFSWNDSYQVDKLIRLLRCVEYFECKKSAVDKLCYLWYLYRFRRMRVKTGIMIFPHTIGTGIKLMHPGFRRIDRFVKIGSNCTILPMVLFGRKRPTDEDSNITVGDNCYISTGVTILGPVKIGNNVVIGAGAVVVKDLPDNCVAAGVPAKIVKMLNVKECKNGGG